MKLHGLSLYPIFLTLPLRDMSKCGRCLVAATQSGSALARHNFYPSHKGGGSEELCERVHLSNFLIPGLDTA